MTHVLGIDIETYSSAPLPKCGVYRYCDAPDFEILLFSYAFDDAPVETVDLACGETLPKEVLLALENPNILKIAYNAQFERVCLSKYLGHWLDPHQWRCTMVMAAYLTLPGRLADAAVALGTTEKKMEEGKDLIRYFSVPCKPSKTNGGRTRNLPTDAPEKWAVYRQYNAQDVETERAIRKALEKYSLPEQEWELYALDQQINDRGVRVDKKLVKNAIAVDAVFAQAAYQRAKELTGLENPGSVNQLKAWLADQDMPMESLARKIVQEKAAQTDGIVAELLNLRLELSKTSVKKYEAMARCVCRDGRVHGLLQFYGANRTGRWAGRLVQAQNLPQNHLPDLDLAREIVKTGDEELLDTLYASVPGTLSELIRTAFIPKDGCRFLVADFSAIEARVLAWLANEEWVLEEFRGKGKIYEATASRMFHIPQESIVKGNPNYEYRQKGKAHGLQRFPLEADGIVKEVMLIIDAADPVAGEHDPVFLLRVGAALGQRHLPVQEPVVHGGCALHGHHVRPPLHHPLVLAEKAVPADVHPIVLVADGLGNAADLLTALQHGHVVFTGFQKLVGGGQSRGARADDEYLFHMRIPRFVIR